MKFEYDPEKSKLNELKHRINFEEAKALWNDAQRIIIPARSDTEPRHAILAMRGEEIWVGFYTLRGDFIRIISVRRARENEKKLYDSGRTR